MDAVDLTNCDREPIHILGNIQPIGFLIAVGADWIIQRAANTEPYLGIEPIGLLGRPLHDIFLPHALNSLRARAGNLRGDDSVERLFSVKLISDAKAFDVALHFSGRSIVIECEPARGDEIEVSSLVRSMITRIQSTETIQNILREGARQVRLLTGFDRVMVYRFGQTGSGEVVAEALEPGIDSFLGLNFPASDIPKQARQLYLRNVFRIIADVNDEPKPIEPVSQTEPLDLSLSLFRAVSPIHVEYLKNMGVRASLSISIIIDGKLWGLFACHHYSPRLPSFAERSAAELFGQMFSLVLESRLRSEMNAYEEKARRVADRLMAAAAQDTDKLTDAQWMGDLVMDAIPADGVGVFVEDNVSLSGLAPNEEQFRRLANVLNRGEASQIFTTNRISEILPEAEEYSSKAAGLLAVPISRRPRDYVVLFRAERLRSVRWAGNQEKEIEYGPNGARLTPRKSFEEWSELVRGEAAPFTDAEMRVADALRSTLLEVVLRLTEAASEDRRRASEQQKLLISELNHRVRNILALIRALVGQTSREADDVGAFINTLDSRIQSLARAHDQLTADQWGPARLEDLIVTEAKAYFEEDRQSVRMVGPDVAIMPDAFTVLALVIHELVTNAAKYGALSDSGTVDVTWQLAEDGSLVIDWREMGGPAVMPPKRRGFGTTVIENSIPHELGGEAQTHYKTAGFEGHFSIPARYVAASRGKEVHKAVPANKSGGEALITGKHVLLVEDSALIALDAEDSLRELGAGEVYLAASNGNAAKVLQERQIDLAVLDFNLGRENSSPTAEKLLNAGIPFIFASGYGGEEVMPEKFQHVPMIVKPYGTEQMGQALAELAVQRNPEAGSD
ncbi:HWE histidine kinase domain-containing protein [Croceicoccus gelatinilyticus]|uniref:HWE histidine kinase domain-containing protein n=1 Tax=Croceicoccus gelatinilyticus TaxID=2835536 RepID=UPI001BCCDC1C|nr:HWE histidine kinase domain-containing protein [Croceicoccus gelatinilyticus]MBS7669715.1 GAF domain-containing protein [Croceicoccus gelatinilyticus]